MIIIIIMNNKKDIQNNCTILTNIIRKDKEIKTKKLKLNYRLLN